MRLGGYRFCMPARLGFELAGCLLRDPYAHVCVLGGGNVWRASLRQQMQSERRLGKICLRLHASIGWV